MSCPTFLQRDFSNCIHTLRINVRIVKYDFTNFYNAIDIGYLVKKELIKSQLTKLFLYMNIELRNEFNDFL